jgi:hypothetical protein
MFIQIVLLEMLHTHLEQGQYVVLLLHLGLRSKVVSTRISTAYPKEGRSASCLFNHAHACTHRY